METNNKNLNSTVLKAATVLDLFAKGADELSISSISEQIQMPMSTTHRLLATLVYTGLMEQNQENGKYRLGLKCYQLGSSVNIIENLKAASLPELLLLSDKYDEVTYVSVNNDDGSMMFVAQQSPKQKLYVSSRVGWTRELQTTGAGKAMLAHMSAEDLANIKTKLVYTKYTENTILNEAQLDENLRCIRQCGYAIDNEEGEIGLCCCAAPLFLGDKCIAAISISIPTARLTCSLDELGSDVIKTAERINAALSGQNYR